MGYCVYEIVNKINGKRYIGSTCYFKTRINRHFNELRKQKHHSFLLQDDFNKYGEQNFKVCIIEDNLDEQIARKKEELLINENYKNLYNISKTSTCGDLISYHPKRDEIVSNLSLIMKQRYKEHPELRKQYKEMFSGENNPMYGHIYTQETKKKMSESGHNKKYSQEARIHFSESMKKRCQDPEFIKKLSLAQKERWKDKKQKEKLSQAIKEKWKDEEYKRNVSQKIKESSMKRAKKVFGDGILYESVSEAARRNNLTTGSIINRCKKKSFPNWYYF